MSTWATLTGLILLARASVGALAAVPLLYPPLSVVVSQIDPASTPRVAPGMAPRVPQDDAFATAPTGDPPSASTDEGTSSLGAGSTEARGYTSQQFLTVWERRREALAAGSRPTADQFLDTLLQMKAQSRWRNYFVVGKALAREALDAAAGDAWDDARRLADAAVRLAPDAPEVHTTLARVRWAGNRDFLGAVSALFEANRRYVAQPALRQARFGNIVLAGVAAFVLAVVAFALSSVYRHARMLVHDLAHLMPSGASGFQAGLIALFLILVPVLLRFGVLWCVLLWVVLMSRYYRLTERVAAAIALCGLAALPVLLPRITGHFGYSGSRAADLFALTHDIGAYGLAGRLEAADSRRPEEAYALGLRALWSGDLKDARWFLESAVDSGARYPELHTTLGNVYHALDDKRRAIAAFEEAARIDANHVIAYFNLSRVYFSMTDHQRASELHRQATSIDYEKVEAYSRLAKRHGRQYLVPEELPVALFEPTDEFDGMHSLAVQQLWRTVGGATPRERYAASALLGLALLVGFAAVRRRGRAPSACERCGGAACRRCHPHLPDLLLCGTCYRAFVTKPTGVQQLRITKQIEGHRYAARRRRVQRVFLILVAGAAQLLSGASVRGMLLLTLFLWLGILVAMGLGFLPEPVFAPHYERLTAVASSVAGSAMVVLYVLAFLDGRRGEG